MTENEGPKCQKCGIELTSGLIAAMCPFRERCEFWPEDEASQVFLDGLNMRYVPPGDSMTTATTTGARVLIDGKPYYPETVIEAETIRLLNDVYGTLWTEAYYDPDSEHTRKFAVPLAEKMKRLNEILGFKK